MCMCMMCFVCMCVCICVQDDIFVNVCLNGRHIYRSCSGMDGEGDAGNVRVAQLRALLDEERACCMGVCVCAYVYVYVGVCVYVYVKYVRKYEYSCCDKMPMSRMCRSVCLCIFKAVLLEHG